MPDRDSSRLADSADSPFEQRQQRQQEAEQQRRRRREEFAEGFGIDEGEIEERQLDDVCVPRAR